MAGAYATGLVGLAFADEVEGPTVRSYLGTWVVVVPRRGSSVIVAEAESKWLAMEIEKVLKGR